jgi:biotin operon repressor
MKEGFWAIPKSIAKRKDLSLKAKLIAGVLWSMRNSDSEAFPSENYLAEALGTSVKTIKRGIRELMEKAGLKVRRRGYGKSNCYTIPSWQGTTLTHQEGTVFTNHEGKVLSHHEGTRLTTIIDNSNKYFNKYNTKVDAKASPIDVVEYFKKRVKELKGFNPEIDYGKDGRLAKERLKKYSFEEIKDLIDWYLNSNHVEKFGASLSICFSNFIINLWKANRAGQKSIEAFYPAWQFRE